MIYSFSVILLSHDKSLELFLAAYQKGLKDSCSVYNGVSGLLASGFKEHPEPKGRWRMTRPGSAVRNHSQVTCVSVHLLHLELLEVAADSTQRRYRPATGHLAGPDAAFHLLQRESLCIITARCLGTEPLCCLLFQIWRTFCGIVSCSLLG